MNTGIGMGENISKLLKIGHAKRAKNEWEFPCSINAVSSPARVRCPSSPLGYNRPSCDLIGYSNTIEISQIETIENFIISRITAMESLTKQQSLLLLCCFEMEVA